MSTARTLYDSSRPSSTGPRHVTLVDLIDRLLAGGVVVHGQVKLAAADIDLVDVDIALLIAATVTAGR